MTKTSRATASPKVSARIICGAVSWGDGVPPPTRLDRLVPCPPECRVGVVLHPGNVAAVGPVGVAAARLGEAPADHIADRDDRDVQPCPLCREGVHVAVAVPVAFADDPR